MAKKQDIDLPDVRCENCKKSIGEADNYLIGCSDTNANPKGYMMGCYPRKCRFFIGK